MPGVTDEAEIEKSEAKKRARKARPGGRPKLINLPRNWLHQAISYMDAGELGFRLAVELLEFIVVCWGLQFFWPTISLLWAVLLAIVIVHTWNWVTNGLFWAVVIFTFPWLRNPGPDKTVDYLNAMGERVRTASSVSGLTIYGSVTRGAWHDRSDIDLRILRRSGVRNLVFSGLFNMNERFRAFLAKQPMDLFLADDTDFLCKMRDDERPVILVKQDPRLDSLYPDIQEGPVVRRHLLGDEA